ncbi:MAG: hypothetical protein ACI88H_001248 [Cocleimonas sp.]|jgi:hypothetical protein
MTIERAKIIKNVRSELVGPLGCGNDSKELAIGPDLAFRREIDQRGFLYWQDGSLKQEIIYYGKETPLKNYGVGVLHPIDAPLPLEHIAANATPEANDDDNDSSIQKENNDHGLNVSDEAGKEYSDDFDISNSDVRRPSTMAISVFSKFSNGGKIVLSLPVKHKFCWQDEQDSPILVNGRYEKCNRIYGGDSGDKVINAWRRVSAVRSDISPIEIFVDDLRDGVPIPKIIDMPKYSPLGLKFEIFPRKKKNGWLITIALRNTTKPDKQQNDRTLFQTFFDVSLINGKFMPYPESERSFNSLEEEEQSLKLLYRESAIWGTGHGCSAGWDAEFGHTPKCIFADVMPAVEMPSMTPDIEDEYGKSVSLSMRTLANLSDNRSDASWLELDNLVKFYRVWIDKKKAEVEKLNDELKNIANKHMTECEDCLQRMERGIGLIETDPNIRAAFRLANLSMLLQQIAAKQIEHRPLSWDSYSQNVLPEGTYISPWDIYSLDREDENLGKWRAFQIAFLLMSLEGCAIEESDTRDIVDLIWFPTGGGKTEAYLGLAAFYLFHQRLIMTEGDTLERDGVNVFMRYTLRMLTTQQFQRAASLICSMEFIRRKSVDDIDFGYKISGRRFSLGLWLGQAAAPNKMDDALTRFNKFQNAGDTDNIGNPLILTECPWCRSQIGKCEDSKPAKLSNKVWNGIRIKGMKKTSQKELLLVCSDPKCDFGRMNPSKWLPVEVVDERLYQYPPSMFIGTADKFAMLAYRPEAGSLFGRIRTNGQVTQKYKPPGLIIQDELHLISGPLGTMYGLYEGIFENLCSFEGKKGTLIKPKIVASTATIRGANQQVKSLYARDKLQLFPSPGLDMGDSFFGKYATQDGKLRAGRLYLGVHAEYGSVQTTQVRTFSTALYTAAHFSEDKKDPWWTLLSFYNSIRELSGGRTLFDSDIRSRLKYLYNRANEELDGRRYINRVHELTSRHSQSKLVELMDELNKNYEVSPNGTLKCIDVCLASNIIEVGVDIDRLSIMSVVGQPKNTAQYIQVTGRVGRKWWERPGLILTIYNPSKSRDRSHFEQFHSYHRRLYEQVESTSATPFSEAAIRRAIAGVLILWVRQQSEISIHDFSSHLRALNGGYQIIRTRCEKIVDGKARDRSLLVLEQEKNVLIQKWKNNPQEWENFPPKKDAEYLMLWPGQYYTLSQRQKGALVASSMRQVDSSALLSICNDY